MLNYKSTIEHCFVALDKERIPLNDKIVENVFLSVTFTINLLLLPLHGYFFLKNISKKLLKNLLIKIV